MGGVRDTWPEDDFLDAVRGHFDGVELVIGAPSDRVAVRVHAVVRVAADDRAPYPRLGARWHLSGEGLAHLPDAPADGEVVLPCGREWLAASMYDEPLGYARLVASEVHTASTRAVMDWETAAERVAAHHDLSPEVVAEHWAALLAELEDWGTVVQVDEGRLEIHRSGPDGPEVITVLMRPSEWAAMRAADMAEYGFDEVAGDIEDDERFLIHDRGTLVKSVREEAPAVRGTAVLRRIAQIRRARPDATFSFVALDSDGEVEARLEGRPGGTATWPLHDAVRPTAGD